MPAFTLYGARGSSNTDRVRLTLAEGGCTDYAMALHDLRKGEQKTGEHLQRHPFGKVPAITTKDGFTLYESRAICKYLARKYSFPLLPAEDDVRGMALFDQAQCVETLYFAEPAGKIIFEKIAKGFMGLPADQVVVRDALLRVDAFFNIAEGLLQQRKYMAGDVFTLVDLYYIPLVQRLTDCGYGDVIMARPAVNEWWDRCISRSAIKDLLAADELAAKEAMSSKN